VPSTIGAELETNPFLRCETKALKERFPGANPIEVFAAVRKAKDSFR
jgi:hydroxyacylglutathione hydrolase